MYAWIIQIATSNNKYPIDTDRSIIAPNLEVKKEAAQ